MLLTIPSQNTKLFKSLINKRISSVKRHIFESDINLDNFEQMADGTTEIEFNSGKVICFFAITEMSSVGIIDGVMEPFGSSYITLELSNNLFWEPRINQEIEAIDILQSKYASIDNPSEFGIEFKFQNVTYVCIEYLDEEDFPDTIRVLEKYDNRQCIRQTIR